MVPPGRMDLRVIDGRGAARGRPSPDDAGRLGRPSPGREDLLRPVDLLLVAYLLVTAVPIVVFHQRLPDYLLYLTLHLAGVVAILRGASPRPANPVLGLARDWYPVIAIVPLYAELGALTRLVSETRHDAWAAGLEERLFGGQPSQTLHALLPSPWVDEYLHLCYFSYYFIPISLALWLTVRRERASLSEALTATLGSFLVCALVFIAFPVAGPYHHFGYRPAAEMAGFFPRIAHGVIQTGSSVGTAFPSSHTAVAFAVWLSAWRLARPLFWVLALVVPGLAVGTVYGGFHYAVDTLAGAAIGCAAAFLAPGAHEAIAAWLSGRRAGLGSAGRLGRRSRLPATKRGERVGSEEEVQ